MPDVYVSKEGVTEKHSTPHNPKKEAIAEHVHTHPKLSDRDERKAMIASVLRKAGEVKRRAVLGAYCVTPGKKFINEQDDEEVVLLLRSHPITNLGWILLVVFLLILPEALSLSGVFTAIPIKYVFMGKLAWYLVTLGFAFESFLNWYYSVFIVTNERIVDIDFHNLLYRVVSYANLNHIEQPSMQMGGLLRSMLRYGDVHVATAAESSNVEGLAVPYPEKVVAIISELSEELEKRRERGE